jgi:hypothetical protein
LYIVGTVTVRGLPDQRIVSPKSESRAMLEISIPVLNVRLATRSVQSWPDARPLRQCLCLCLFL